MTPDIRRWCDNVPRGSRISADIYLRRFGSNLKEKNLSPHDLPDGLALATGQKTAAGKIPPGVPFLPGTIRTGNTRNLWMNLLMVSY